MILYVTIDYLTSKYVNLVLTKYNSTVIYNLKYFKVFLVFFICTEEGTFLQRI